MPLQMAGQEAKLSLTAGMGVLDQSSGSLISVWYPSYPQFLYFDLRLALYAALEGSITCSFRVGQLTLKA